LLSSPSSPSSRFSTRGGGVNPIPPSQPRIRISRWSWGPCRTCGGQTLPGPPRLPRGRRMDRDPTSRGAGAVRSCRHRQPRPNHSPHPPPRDSVARALHGEGAGTPAPPLPSFSENKIFQKIKFFKK
jgi:hypothetical protein